MSRSRAEERGRYSTGQLAELVARGLGLSLQYDWLPQRLGFYRKHGFHTLGEEFDMPGIGPHSFMYWSQRAALPAG